MISKTQIRCRFRPFFTCSARYLFGAVLLLFLCSSSLFAQNAQQIVTIKLPDESTMRFHAVYLGIDGNSLFASRRVKLGSREGNPSYKERLVETLLSGSFVGKRNGKADWLYYLSETEVKRSQWNSVMSWMNEQEGKNSTVKEQDKKHPELPRTGVTIAEIYRFTEALNSWMLRNQSSQLPKFGNARAFCRLPTEAEWAFAARGGIEVNQAVFERPHLYGEKLGKHEWHRVNTNSKVQKCGSKDIQPNPIGLKDMLGNVEELTVSLFSPEYQQGRFGQFVIRGNNYSDSPEDFAVSHRAEFTSHNQNGKLRHPSKVGFRLALSTAITSAGKSTSELDKGFETYLQARSLTRPGLVGHSSPATQAKEDTVHYLQEQLKRIREDNKQLDGDISRLEKLRNSDQKQYAATQQVNRKLSNANNLLEEEISKLHYSLSSTPNLGELKKLKQQLTALRNKKIKVDEKFKKLKKLDLLGKVRHENAFVSGNSSKELSRKLKEREQELDNLKRNQKQALADLGRRQQLYEHEVTKNAGRVREVEKRYLEALMRQASANAYIGWRILKKRDVYLRRTGRNASDEKAQEAFAEASLMINDYWHLVVQMAEETQADLFPQVKQELSDWLQQQERKGVDSRQRKALNLIERHLAAVRAGKSLRPDDLVSSFLTQPEFL